jgi:hypothetical protein
VRDPEHDRVGDALILARADASKPSTLGVQIPPDAPPELKAQPAALKTEFAARVTNVAVYRRHEAELAPIPDVLLLTGEQEMGLRGV